MTFVYIVWTDAVRNRREWMTLGEVREWMDLRSMEIHEAGFEVANTDDMITLAAAYQPENEYSEPQYNGITKIPKTWIRKRVELFTIDEKGTVTFGKRQQNAGRNSRRARSKRSA